MLTMPFGANPGRYEFALELFGKERWTVVEFGYDPSYDGDDWHPAYPSEIEILSVETTREEKKKWLPDGGFRPRTEYHRVELLPLLDDEQIRDLAQEIEAAIENQSIRYREEVLAA